MSDGNRDIIGYFTISPLFTNKNEINDYSKKIKADILMVAKKHDLSNIKFVSEKSNSTKSWGTRELSKVVESMKANDVLIVPELSKLGRNLVDVLEVLKILSDKNVKIISVKENYRLNGDDIESKVIHNMFSLFSGVASDIVSLRTKEGLFAAKAKGALLGRPKGVGKSKLDKNKSEILLLLRNGATKKYVSERFGCTPANLINWLRRHGSKHLTDAVLDDYYIAGIIAPTLPEGISKKYLLDVDFQDILEIKRAEIRMLRESKKHKPLNKLKTT